MDPGSKEAPPPPAVGGQIRSMYAAHQAEISRRRSVAEKELTEHPFDMRTGFDHLKSKDADRSSSGFNGMSDPDQAYFVFNISHAQVPPRKNGDDPGVRICGVFASSDQASDRAKLISSSDPDCSVLIAPMQQWVTVGSTIELLTDDEWCRNHKDRLLVKYSDEVENRDKMFHKRLGDPSADTPLFDGPPADPPREEPSKDPPSRDSNSRSYSRPYSRDLEVRNQNIAVVSFIRDDESADPAHPIFIIWRVCASNDEANKWVTNVAGDQIGQYSLDTVDMYEWIFPQLMTDEKANHCAYRNPEEHNIMSFARAQESTVEGFKQFCQADGREAPYIEI